MFKKLAKVIQNENNCRIKSIRSGHEGEFENESFNRLCEKNMELHIVFMLLEPHKKLV